MKKTIRKDMYRKEAIEKKEQNIKDAYIKNSLEKKDKISKRKIVKEDGRYLIYYSF